MEQEKQMAMMINQILIVKGFYLLNYKTLADILSLLGKEMSWNPSVIRAMAIEGLTQIAQNEQKLTQGFFCQLKFQSISAWSKEFVYSTIQEVISARHRIFRKKTQETMTRNISQINFPILAYSGFPPQIGFINQNTCFNEARINADPIQYQQQMNFTFNTLYTQDPIQKQLQPNPLINDKQLKIEFVHQKSQEDQKPLQKIQNKCDEFKAQDIQNKSFVMVNQACEIQNQGEQILKKYIFKEKISEIKEKDLSEQIQKLIILPKSNIKQVTSSTIQIQTDLNFMQIGLKKAKSNLPRLQERENMEEQKQSQSQSEIECQIQHFQHLEFQSVAQQSSSKKNQKEKVNPFTFFTKNEEVGHVPQLLNEECHKFQQIAQKEIEYSNEQIKMLRQIPRNQLRQDQEINFQSNLMQLNEQEKIELLQIMHPQEEIRNKFDLCLCKGKFFSLNIFMCDVCMNSFHFQCLEDKQQLILFNFQCPICKIRTIDPFQKVKNVIGQFYIKDITNNKFSVAIDVSPYSHLKQNKGNTKGLVTQKQNDIEIRCLKIEKTYQRSQITWPDQVILSVNDRKLTQTYGLLLNSKVKKRVDQSIVITQQALTLNQYIQQQDFSKVTIQMQFKQLSPQDFSRKQVDNNHTYLFGVYFIERIKLSTVYEDILQNIQPFEQNYANKLFSYQLEDSQIVVDFMTCRIRDPYSGSLINYPVRGSNCMHLQCFDLKNYLNLIWGSKNRLWRCPFCSKQAKKFKVDEQQLQLIKRLEGLKIIPEQIIYLSKGDLILKLEVDQEKIVTYDEEFKENSMDEEKNLVISINVDQSQQKQEKKGLVYKYFEYLPKIDLRQVLFTGRECFNKPKVQKTKIVKKPEKEKPKKAQKNSKKK